MSRNTNPVEPSEEHEQPRASRAPAPLVLVVSASSERRASLASAMRQDNLSCAFAETTEAAMLLVRARIARNEAVPFEAVLVDLASCNAAALRFVRELGQRRIASVIVCPNLSFDEAVEAMRAGASDIVTTGVGATELGRRVRSAVAQQRAAKRAGDEGADAEQEAVASRKAARPRTKAQKRSLSEPLTADAAALAERFAAQIRSELDVETLLREVLEFLLVHVGPTNAAVFLPGTGGDYSLGAYVNYTCPKDTAEVLLDHLANIAAPRLEQTMGVLTLKSDEQISEHVGDGIQWLEGSHMVAFTCRHDGECLAVFTLFRDCASPFGDDARPLLQRISEVFGSQLSRVIRIHHRHLPRDKWGSLGDPSSQEDDEGGMAA